jgi:hypothetical protein
MDQQRAVVVEKFDRKWLKYHYESTVELITEFQRNAVPRYVIVGVYLLPDNVAMEGIYVHKGNKQYAEWNLIILFRLFTLQSHVSYLESQRLKYKKTAIVPAVCFKCET